MPHPMGTLFLSFNLLPLLTGFQADMPSTEVLKIIRGGSLRHPRRGHSQAGLQA